MVTHEEDSVHDLLVRLKRGDMEALANLYSQYAKYLHDRAKCLYNKSTSKELMYECLDDIVQQTFINILAGIGGYQEEKRGGLGWMVTICRHCVINSLRRNRPTEELPKDIVNEDVDPARLVEISEYEQEASKHLQALEQAWNELLEEDREAIRKGRGPGNGRKGWHRAVKRLSMWLFKKYDAAAYDRAWARTSKEDREAIQRGLCYRDEGKEWHEAVNRFRSLFIEEHKRGT